MTLAAKRLAPAQFGLWAGVILSLGNTGMLLSSSPLALMVDQWGWRSGYWAGAGVAVAIAAMVLALVPSDTPQECDRRSTISEIADILRMGVGGNLRGIIILSFVSLAAQIVLRGLWVGPWLMDVKGISRIEAGNILALFTVAIVLAPMLSGFIDSKLNNPRYLLLAVHLVAALLLLIMALGAPNYALSRMIGWQLIPVWVDSIMLVLIGLLVSMQSLLFAFARQVVADQNIGKALAATNLSCMIGTAVMQFITSPVALVWGLPATFILMAGSLAAGAAAFFFLTRSAA
jgi:predicted MFS family arabinose efflux permease